MYLYIYICVLNEFILNVKVLVWIWSWRYKDMIEFIVDMFLGENMEEGGRGISFVK